MVKYVELQQDGSVEIKEVLKPSLEEGTVLLKVVYSEVCGTDVHLQKGQLAGVPYPIIPGHVSVGIIEDLHGYIVDVEGNELKKNDHITFLDVHETCNKCWYCLVKKQTTRCPKRKVYGITYSANDGLLGGWSEYIYLKPGVKILKIKQEVPLKSFMAGGCGLPTAIHAIERANIQLGDTVVVQGAGPVGLMAALLSKIRGSFNVIIVDYSDVRIEIAKKFDLKAVNIKDLTFDERVKKISSLTDGKMADVVIEASGNPKAVKEGMNYTRDGGTYVIVGQYTNAGDAEINPHLDINKKHLTIKGSWGSDFSHFYLAVKFIENFYNKLPLDLIISREYNLEEINDALNDVKNLKVMKALINPFKI